MFVVVEEEEEDATGTREVEEVETRKGLNDVELDGAAMWESSSSLSSSIVAGGMRPPSSMGAASREAKVGRRFEFGGEVER